MDLNEIADNPGARRKYKRVGRGIGSGKGKTCGRGVKGQKARAGVAVAGFEGGQMPIYRRLPKRGFKNVLRREYQEVNVGRIQKAIDEGKLDAAQPIDAAALIAAGVIRRSRDGLRLLAQGELKAPIRIQVVGASKAAVAAVEGAGGSVTLGAPKPEAESSAGA
jgi:large subunit ribosomal protein L15